MTGALVLLFSALLVKCIGMFYKIPLIGTLGGEGMGYFGAAYDLYALFCVIATAGLPVALSILVSGALARGDREGAVSVFRTARRLFLGLGLGGTLILFFGAEVLSGWIRDPGAAPCIRAIAPALLFVCLGSAVRGYRQGCGEMMPTAVSQVIEALGKLCLGLAFAGILSSRGASSPIVAAGAAAGISCGSAAAWIYLCFFAPQRGRAGDEGNRRGHEGRPDGLVRLLRIAVPVTVSASVLMLTRLSDMFLILRRLQSIGQSAAEANAAYGIYTTMAVPLFAAMPALLTSLAMALVPSLTDAVAREDGEEVRRVVGSALRITFLCGFPATLGLSLFARPILAMLFVGNTDELALAVPQLTVLALSVLFSCMITVSNSILQAFGEERKTVWFMLAGGVLKVVSAWVLIGIPSIGLLGAPISTFLCDLLITALNLARIVRRVGIDASVGRTVVRVTAVTLPALGGGWIVCKKLTARGGFLGRFGVVPGLFVTVGIFAVLVLFSGVLTDEDLRMMPRGQSIGRFLGGLKHVIKRKKTGTGPDV